MISYFLWPNEDAQLIQEFFLPLALGLLKGSLGNALDVLCFTLQVIPRIYRHGRELLRQ